MLTSVLFSALVLSLASCRPQVTNRNLDAVNSLYESAEKNGRSVTIKEVESVLGQPIKIVSFPIEMKTTKELPVVRYYYRQDGETVELHFIENKLIRRVYHFGDVPMPETEVRKMRSRQK